jgi:DNA helicase II / ATP-dependent DNA helicase PcrA
VENTIEKKEQDNMETTFKSPQHKDETLEATKSMEDSKDTMLGSSRPLEHGLEKGCGILPESFQAELDSLNPEQRQAVTAHDGPCLVSASAGTGKTRVLTMRYAYLFYKGYGRPGEILAVTFTNRAAQEMRERIQKWIPVNHPAALWLGTFHNLSWRILRTHASAMGFPAQPSLLDAYDRLQLVRKILKGENNKKQTPQEILWAIEQWKQKAILPQDLEKKPLQGFNEATYRKIYGIYQEQLTQMNHVDFDDLLIYPLGFLEKNEEVRQMYQRKFRYILVDEYQDVNRAQYMWLKALMNPEDNFFCVGDDDQAIYGWRGADVENILRFPKDFPKAQLIQLEVNYRSSESILTAASSLIGYNKNRYAKVLRSAKAKGDAVIVQSFWDGKEEAHFIAETLKTIPTDRESVAILVRASFQTREFEERFALQKIPYRILGGQRFYDRQEIRDILAYLKIVAVPTDNIAFERALNMPKKGLGPAVVGILYDIARSASCSLLEALAIAQERQDLFRPSAFRALSSFFHQVRYWSVQKDILPLPQLIEQILEESGYYAMLKQDASAQSEGRLENLKELIKSTVDFASLSEFLEHVGLIADPQLKDASVPCVVLLTLHGAKGLEFDTVFLPGWEENIFPNPRCLKESPLKGLEEERRLAYVGMTRARKRVWITFAWNRRLPQGWVESVPSRFIEELPKDGQSVHWVTDNRGVARDMRDRSRAQYAAGLDDSVRHSQKKDFHSGYPSSPGMNRKKIPYGPDSSFKQSLDNPYVGGNENKLSLKRGSQVQHAIFGIGSVENVFPDYVQVFFATHGSKKIISRFLQMITPQ